MSYRPPSSNWPREHAEALSDAQLELGAMSVSVEDADADTPNRHRSSAGPGVLTQRTPWQHLARGRAARHDHETGRAARGRRELDRLVAETPAFTVREVEEQDWVRLTQSQFDPDPDR